ncbi:MAG: acetyl-CoA carboxylase carboxyltransferase subunit alpha [Kiritimatiellae bacterium]|nr:acetyl-CoA carboxylase carboxyltransferase subunit alpha [Kiritimatiellia bacterium]
MAMEFEKTLLETEQKIAELQALAEKKNVNFGTELAQLKRKKTSLMKSTYAKLTPWDTVQVARHNERPLIRDYINGMCDEFLELRGDRCFGDDQGIIGGFAKIDERRVMLIGHQKGKTTEDNIKSNFGMANPEGYRKALRLMKLAEKFRIPVVCLIDTPGAYPGLEAEARGQAQAIAQNLTEMSRLATPIIVIVTGEGGSGGAIGIGVGDVVMMLANSVYSVISPEGCASILWRDGTKAPIAADALKITADSLLKLGIIDEIIPEPIGGAHRNYTETLQSVKDAILKNIERLRKTSRKRLVEKRFAKYAAMGRYY